MFSLNPIFLGLTLAYFPIFWSLSTGDGSCKSKNFAGLNRACSKNIRISILTRKINIGIAPFYDADSNTVYFTGDGDSTVYRYSIDSKRLDSKKLGNETVNFIVPIEGVPDHFIISYGANLAHFEWSRGRAVYRIISQPDPAHPWPKYLLNHAVVSENGVFFFFSEPNPIASGNSLQNIPKRQCTLFSLANGKQKTQIRGLTYGSGPAFNPSGNELYFSDGYFNESYIATYNERRNSIVNYRVFLKYPQLCIPGRLGVFAFDTDGFLYLATDGGYRILKLDPYSGTVVCSIKLPVSVLYFIFGRCPHTEDSDPNCMYLTTAAAGSPPSKYNGPLLVIKGLRSTGVLRNKVPLKAIFGNRREYYPD